MGYAFPCEMEFHQSGRMAVDSSRGRTGRLRGSTVGRRGIQLKRAENDSELYCIRNLRFGLPETMDLS